MKFNCRRCDFLWPRRFARTKLAEVRIFDAGFGASSVHRHGDALEPGAPGGAAGVAGGAPQPYLLHRVPQGAERLAFRKCA